MREIVFQVGDKVEVVMHELGYKGSYYSIAVTRIEEERCVIEFDNLINTNRAILQQVTHLKQLSPYPSMVVVNLKENFVVDTRDINGWMLRRL